MNLADAPDVMKVRDVAEILDCDPKTVYKLIDEEELDVVRVGRNYRVTRQALESYLGIETTNGAVELLGVLPDDPHGVE